jgi:hypothetical protein
VALRLCWIVPQLQRTVPFPPGMVLLMLTGALVVPIADVNGTPFITPMYDSQSIPLLEPYLLASVQRMLSPSRIHAVTRSVCCCCC